MACTANTQTTGAAGTAVLLNLFMYRGAVKPIHDALTCMAANWILFGLNARALPHKSYTEYAAHSFHDAACWLTWARCGKLCSQKRSRHITQQVKPGRITAICAVVICIHENINVNSGERAKFPGVGCVAQEAGTL